jgi:methanesulfonate monooxygenase subunit alpha
MKQEGYFERKMIPFPSGHAEVGSQEVHYEAYEGGKRRADAGFPGVEGNPWSLIDLFPGYSYNLRASVLRVDSLIPLGPNKTVIEYRSLGLKSDTEKQRRQRVADVACPKRLVEEVERADGFRAVSPCVGVHFCARY